MGYADSTLVGAAYRASMAGVPADMSGIHEKMAESHKKSMENITKTFKSYMETTKAYNKEMDDTLQPLLNSTENGTFVDGMLDTRLDKIQGFKDEWKKIPRGKNGDKERAEWKNKVSRYLNSQQLATNMLSSAATLSKNGQLEDLEPNDAQLVTGIANLFGGKTDAETVATEIDNGDGTTSYFIMINDPENPGTKIKYTKTVDELNGLLPVKHHGAATKVESLITGILADGKLKNSKYGDNEILSTTNDIVNFINDTEDPRSAWRTLSTLKTGGMEISFKEALHTQGDLSNEIIKALAAAGKVTDEDNSGTIDQKDVDMMNAANYKAMVSNILDDQNVGARVFGDWFARTEGQSQFKKGNQFRPVDKDDGSKTGGHVGGPMPGVGWVKGEKKQEYRGYIDKFADFQGNYGNWKFDEVEGKYYDSDAKEKVYITAYEVAQKEDAAKGDSESDFKYNKAKVEAEKPKNEAGETVVGGVFGSFFQEDDDDQIIKMKRMFPPSFTFKETGQFLGMGFGFGVEIHHPTEGLLGTYKFDRSGGEDANNQAKAFNTAMAPHFTEAYLKSLP